MPCIPVPARVTSASKRPHPISDLAITTDCGGPLRGRVGSRRVASTHGATGDRLLVRLSSSPRSAWRRLRQRDSLHRRRCRHGFVPCRDAPLGDAQRNLLHRSIHRRRFLAPRHGRSGDFEHRRGRSRLRADHRHPLNRLVLGHRCTSALERRGRGVGLGHGVWTLSTQIVLRGRRGYDRDRQRHPGACRGQSTHRPQPDSRSCETRKTHCPRQQIRPSLRPCRSAWWCSPGWILAGRGQRDSTTRSEQPPESVHPARRAPGPV